MSVDQMDVSMGCHWACSLVVLKDGSRVSYSAVRRADLMDDLSADEKVYPLDEQRDD